MEIIIALVVVVAAAFLYFNRKPKTETTAEVAEVPYKVETPVAEQASQAMVESVVKEAPAKKPRATKAPAAKKPAAKKTAAKKPKAE